MKDFLFKPDMSYVDVIFFSVVALGLAEGHVATPLIIMSVGLCVHMLTTNRWYD